MQPSDPASLSNLHDLALPAEISWWPPAPGWYGLAVVLLIVAMVFSWRAWHRWCANRYRRAALAELQALFERTRNGERTAALQTLPALVKRTALAAFPRQEVASLSGSVWLSFLDRTGRTDAFSQGVGRRLEALAYEPSAVDGLEAKEMGELFGVVRHWVRHHYVDDKETRS